MPSVYDLTGDGSGYATAHREAFTDGGGGALACGGLLGCVGYELLAEPGLRHRRQR